MTQMKSNKDQEIEKLKVQIEAYGPISSNSFSSFEDLNKKYEYLNILLAKSEEVNAEKDAKIEIMEAEYDEEMNKIQSENESLKK